LLFAVVNPGSRESDDPKRIIVNRDGLLTFIQYRTKTFQPKLAVPRLDAMSGGQ
jgi:hypothetical protein